MFPPLRLREALSLGGLSPRELAVRTWHMVTEHEILTRASAVSFYAMLASVPFLAILLTLAVQLLPDVSGLSGERGFGNLTVEELDETLRSLVPDEAYKVVAEQIERIQKEPPVGLLSIGLAISLWTASSLFLAVIDAMNVIYGVKETRPFWKLRLTAIAMTLVQAAILIGSLLMIVVGPMILRWVGLTGATTYLALAIQWGVVGMMVLMSFALSFFVGPDADQKWEWITPGSLIGTFAFLGASLLFRLYIQNVGGYDKAYGSLGGVMVLLFWFWVSSVVLLTAAQLNKVIEEASPLGKSYGQKEYVADEAPDLKSAPPEPADARDAADPDAAGLAPPDLPAPEPARGPG